MSAPDDFTALLERFAPGARLLRTFQLKGGISALMTRLDFEHVLRGRSAVVVRQLRWGTPAMRREELERELRTLELARDLELLAPRPRGIDMQGEPTLLLEYIEALPDFAPTSVAEMTREMARALRQIHQVSGTDPRLGFLPRSAESSLAALATRPEQLDASLGEASIREALAAAGSVPRDNPDVLLHGDFWPGNLLWKNGRIAAVVDWEEAAVGDPLFDLAIARLDVLWAFGWQAMQGFTQHYRAIADIDYRALAWWDLRVALRPMHHLARWAAGYVEPPISRADINEETMRTAHRAFVEQAMRRLQPADEGEVAILEIEDSIDLHGFLPRDIPDVVQDYLEEARARGFREVRLIHGRGKGVQRARVQALLSQHPFVQHFTDAPATRGGWGATIVHLALDDDGDVERRG